MPYHNNLLYNWNFLHFSKCIPPPTVIIQRTTDGFYLEEMPTQVTQYIKYLMIADTQAQLLVLELGQKL